jgi:hypothetical protein
MVAAFSGDGTLAGMVAAFSGDLECASLTADSVAVAKFGASSYLLTATCAAFVPSRSCFPAALSTAGTSSCLATSATVLFCFCAISALTASIACSGENRFSSMLVEIYHS